MRPPASCLIHALGDPTPPPNGRVVFLQTLNFGVMNSDNSDEVGDGSVADTFYTYMTSTYPETADRFLYYETESEFEDIISSSSYSQEAPSEDVIGFSAGIVFSSGSPDWSYTVRLQFEGRFPGLRIACNMMTYAV